MNKISISDFSFGILVSQVIIGLFSILAIYFIVRLLLKLNKYLSYRNKQIESQNRS